MAGGGGISFDTQKLAFGQRIGLRTDNTSTAAIVKAIDSLTQVPGDLTSVLGALFGGDAAKQKWGYDPSVEWLVGLEVAYSVVNFDILLVDGQFYGLRIKIGSKPKPPDPPPKNGEKSEGDGDGNGNGENGNGENGNGNGNGKKDEPFAGLTLEILYRKVNDHLGEFSADLTLPKKYRKIQLEAASLTLPSVGLAIWTNGDFKVSIGWPLGDRSLSIIFPPDPIPWAGGGGLYFAKLRSEDAAGLGKDFGTIIEFGIALRIGAAAEGEYGILEWGASLYLFGTFQGFLAWRTGHSISSGVDYYWFAATIGLEGKLSGEIDFKILSVSIELTLTASAGLAIETAHRSVAVFEFKAEVEASIKILFFKITFSYTLDFKKEIPFGSGSEDASLDGPSPPDSLRAARAPVAALGMATEALAALPPAPPWATPAPPVVVQANLLLQPTVRYDQPSSTWKPAGVASLIVQRPAPGTGTGGTDSFTALVASLAAFLAKQFANAGPTDPITAAQLDAVSQSLDAGDFALDTIYGWMKPASPAPPAVTFTITGVTSTSPAPKDPTVAVLPMIPGLQLTYGPTQLAFGGGPEPPEYEKVLTDYFARLSLVGDGSLAGAVLATAPAPAIEWFAGVIFHDYFNMLGKQAVKEMHDLADGTATVAQLIGQLNVDNLAGMVTRFLHHGLRLPDPAANSSAPDAPTRGLYELTGQQFDLVQDSGNWVTTATLTAPAPPVPVTVAAGTAELKPAVTQAPEASPLQTPYALDRIKWVPTASLLRQAYGWTKTTTSATTYSLFDFPETLQAQLRLNSPLQLVLTTIDDQNHTAPLAGQEALVIRFSLSPVTPMPAVPVFQVAGTDDATRDLMELLFDAGDPATCAVDLLLPGATTGTYTTVAANAAATLVKTDLSSANQPALSALFADLATNSPSPPLGPTSASLADADPTAFLRLLWECSVVHSGGFYLTVPDASALKGSSSYEVALLVRPPTAAASTLKVDAYHTTIVTAATSARVQAAILDADGNPVTEAQPNYPPGAVGFGAAWTDADTPKVPADVEAADTPEYAAALYQLLQFSIAGDDVLEASGWSQPLGPDGDAGGWTYRRAAPVQRFVKDAPSNPNRYIAIGHTTKLDLQLVDVYGNAQPLSSLPVMPVYNDALIGIDEWPGTTAQYAFAFASAGSATLTIDVAFDPSQVPKALDPQGRNIAQEQYAVVLDQLTDPRVSITVTSALASGPVAATAGGKDARTALAGLVTQIVAALDPKAPGPAPAPVTLTATVPTAYAGEIGVDMFPVWVSITTTRDLPAETKPYTDYPPDFVSVTSPVALRLGADADPDAALAAWAGDFEKAFAAFDGKDGLLKVLSGKPPTKVTATATALGAGPSGDVTSVPGDVWALRWSAASGVSVDFGNAGGKANAGDPDAPVYFTPMPLATELLGGQVDITAYDDSGKAQPNPVTTTFSGVDLDMWGRSFLAAFDDLLTPELAAAMARVDATGYAALMTAKEDVAYAIASGVSWVYADQMPPNPGDPGAGDLTAAQTVFREGLLSSLSTDFATSAIVQIPADVKVNGPFELGAGSRPPELFGSPSPPTGETAGQYTFTSATLPVVAGTGSVTFLAEVVHPTQQSDLCLPFAYDLAFVDHRFQMDEERYGYVPSSWLRFVLPIADPATPTSSVLEVPMGKLDIPIPLRAYPSPPRLVSQTITADHETPTTIADALTATYTLTVGTPTVAQDTVHLSLRFNGATGEDAPGVAAGSPPLFGPLAAFSAFQSAGYLDKARTAIVTNAPSAKQWLATLLSTVQAVATGWQASGAETEVAAEAVGTPPAPLPFTWEFALHVPDESKPVVILEWTGDPQKVPPDAGWPQMTGATRGPVDARSRSYTFGSLPTELALGWSGLSVVLHQRITTAARIVRNEELGSACPGTPKHGTTNPGLTYSTATVTFSDPVVPLLQVPGTITLASTSATDAIGQLVDGLVPAPPPATQVGFDVETAYAFTLVTGDPGTLGTRLPIFLSRTAVSTADTLPDGVVNPATLKANLAGQLLAWQAALTPASANARVLFGVTLFAAGSEQPILRLLDVEAPVGGDWWK